MIYYYSNIDTYAVVVIHELPNTNKDIYKTIIRLVYRYIF